MIVPNIYPVLEVEDSILRQKSDLVLTAEEAIEVVTKLEKAMSEMRDCLGLAANQIGIPKAIAIIRHNGLALNLINPVIVKAEDPFIYKREGCMSYPGRRYNVERFQSVWLEYDALWSHSGNARKPDEPDYIAGQPTRLVRRQSAFNFDADPLITIGVQHELDHLQGIVLPFKTGADEVERTGVVSLAPSQKVSAGRNDPCPCGSGRKYKKCCGK
jgi:peptide deformylase